MTTPLKTWMRSLEPAITFTCTFTVSPGLKAGISSRSDVWSTKSSVFIGDTSLLVAAAGSCTHGLTRCGRRADGFGCIWAYPAAGGDTQPTRTTAQLCQIGRTQ